MRRGPPPASHLERRADRSDRIAAFGGALIVNRPLDKETAEETLEEEEKNSSEEVEGVMEGVTVYAYDLPRGDVLAYYPEANVLTGTAVDPRSRTPSGSKIGAGMRLAARNSPRISISALPLADRRSTVPQEAQSSRGG